MSESSCHPGMVLVAILCLRPLQLALQHNSACTVSEKGSYCKKY